MHQSYPHTAILLFLRDEQEEAHVKAFDKQLGARSSIRVIHTLNRHLMKESRRAGLPVFTIRGDQQIGHSFGERFANAFETVFEAGFERVIALGNDCLSLSKGHILRVKALFEEGHSVVLGPAKDGGAYVVGISRQVYQRQSFINLPWQTEQVFDALVAYARQKGGGCGLLPPAFDFDDANTLYRLLQCLPATLQIVRLLRDILLQKRHQPVVSLIFIISRLTSVNSLRAPPVLGLL